MRCALTAFVGVGAVACSSEESNSSSDTSGDASAPGAAATSGGAGGAAAGGSSASGGSSGGATPGGGAASGGAAGAGAGASTNTSASCLPALASCGATAECCAGAVCLQGKCRPTCAGNADCGSRCCQEDATAGAKICVDAALCAATTCHDEGAVCDPGAGCCDGLVCVESTVPDWSGCRITCTADGDCASGCCLPFANATSGFCAEARFCTCSPVDWPCGGSTHCCDGFACTTAAADGGFACRPVCTADADCGASECCKQIVGTDQSVCLSGSWCN